MDKVQRTRHLQVLVVAAILAAALVMGTCPVALAPAREEARRIRCRNNLNQLMKALSTYQNDHPGEDSYPWPLGRGLRPDDFSGAEWLACLYWMRIVPDPDVFLCPSSRDTSHKGADLGTDRAIAGRFGSQTVSYAGLHYRSFTSAEGRPIRPPADVSPIEPVACDDTQGGINHGTAANGGMSVLFFDCHVEFWSQSRVDVERGVGMKGGELWRLRN